MLAERREGVAVRIPDTVQALIASRIDRLPPDSTVGRAPRRARRARLLARRGRRARSGARRRHRARRPRRPPAPHARADLDDLGRDRVPLPPRPDPRRRVRGPRQGRAGEAPPRVRRMAARAVGRRARRGAGATTSSAPRRSRRSSTGRSPPTSAPRRPRCSSAPGAGRSTARRTAPRGGCCCARSSSSRASSAGSMPRGRPGGCGSFPRRPSRWRTSARWRRRRASARSRASPSRSSPRSTLNRNADVERARTLALEALELLSDAPGDARSEALTLLSSVGWWRGDLESVERYIGEALEIAREAGRADLESLALSEVAAAHLARLQLARADTVLEARGRAGDVERQPVGAPPGSPASGARSTCAGDASTTPSASSARRAGCSTRSARHRTRDGRNSSRAWPSGRAAIPTAPSRSSARRFASLLSLQERAKVIEAQRTLAELVLAKGHVEEAERWALSAVETVGMQDTMSRSNVRMVLGLVRAAQGRDDEAELLLRERDRLARRHRLPQLRAGAARGLRAVPARPRPRRGGVPGSRSGSPSCSSRRARPGSSERGADRLARRLVRRLGDDRRRALEAGERRRGAGRRGACRRRRAGASSRCGSRTRCRRSGCGTARPARARRRRARAPRGTARARRTRRRSSRACARSRSPGRTQPARRLISTQSSSEPRSRTRPITSIPNGTARSFPSSRSRTSASCSTTASIASSRLRPSRKPGWKTTTSAPHAAAIPALRSSAPSADDHFRPLASRCPTQPKSGACTESATSCSRASSPSRSAHG